MNNSFTANGRYGNPTNGQFDQVNVESHPTDCFAGNRDTGGRLSPDAVGLQATHGACTGAPSENFNLSFANEVVCDAQLKVPLFGCRPGDRYPRRTKVVMHHLPAQPTMPHPCAGVPANPWCPAHRRAASDPYG